MSPTSLPKPMLNVGAVALINNSNRVAFKRDPEGWVPKEGLIIRIGFRGRLYCIVILRNPKI